MSLTYDEILVRLDYITKQELNQLHEEIKKRLD